MKKITKFAKAALAACIAGAMALMMAGCSNSSGYTPELGEALLSSPAIAENGVLRVGVNTNNSPLAGKSGDKIIGVDVDVAAALADSLGLSLKTVDVGADAEVALEEDQVDLVLGVESGNDSEGFWLSDPYMTTGVVLFEMANSEEGAPAADSQPKIAAQVSSKSAWAVTNTFGEDCLVSANDLSSAFTDLATEKVNYVASDAIIGMYAANRANISVKIAALIDSATGYCAMVKSDNTELQDAVQVALEDLVKSGVVDVIEKKWLGSVVDLSMVSKIETKKAPQELNGTTVVKGGAADNDTEDEDDSASSTSSSSSSSVSSSSSSSKTTGDEGEDGE